jgi:hypothetical protein
MSFYPLDETTQGQPIKQYYKYGTRPREQLRLIGVIETGLTRFSKVWQENIPVYGNKEFNAIEIWNAST